MFTATGSDGRHERPSLILVSLGGSEADVVATGCRSRGRAELQDDVSIVIFSVDKDRRGGHWKKCSSHPAG